MQIKDALTLFVVWVIFLGCSATLLAQCTKTPITFNDPYVQGESMSITIINGKTYKGNNIRVINNRVIVDGRQVSPEGDEVFEAGPITINIQGTLESLSLQVDSAESCVVHGNVGGDVEVDNNVHIEGSVQGHVEAGNSVHVQGNVHGGAEAMNTVEIDGDLYGKASAMNKVVVKGQQKKA